ncbi:MAG: hypothetical protein ABJB12_17620 [Pseudomonadota bacterium]
MTRALNRIGLGLLAVVGLSVTVFMGVVLVGVIIGYASTYRKSPERLVERYVECDATHPSAACVELAKRAAAAPAKSAALVH